MSAKTTFHVGTSGFSYDEWIGSFYPEDLPKKRMLEHYASQFGTVEINNTFYRLPSAKLLEDWKARVPMSFQFCLKMAQKVTHFGRLKVESVEDAVRYFFETKRLLGASVGPTLIQLPPNMKKDAARLRDFFALVPTGERMVLEFGSSTWLDEEIFDLLRTREASLCIVDDEKHTQELVHTAPFGYFRLRRVEYTDKALAEWKRRIGAAGYAEAYVFFKHEDEGTGPKLAKRFLAL